MSKTEKKLLFVNLLMYISIWVYSFTQVDLNLTLVSNQYAISFISWLQNFGYYQRPASAFVYVLFISLLFLFFIYNLRLFYKSKIGFKYLLVSALLNTGLLVTAYPFLSADIFNYIFDAKIILKYQASPYVHKPLDFPNDDWLRFMRWTHRYSPYGPFWLFLSLIPAALGFGKFILNLFFFKMFIALFHFLNIFLIYKILKKLNPKNLLFGTAFYALNPLILIEGIANGHNDILQATFLLTPIFFLINNNKLFSVLTLAAGSLIKYLSILMFPIIFLDMLTKKQDPRKLITLTVLILSIFIIIYSTVGLKVPFVSQGSIQVQFQPWYLIWIIPLISLVPESSLIAVATGLSLGASLRYSPFLYYGDWSRPLTVIFMQTITILPASITLLYTLIKNRFNVKDVL